MSDGRSNGLGVDAPFTPTRLVVMGVAGAGKTTVGRVLAARLGVPFVDADDFHSAAAVAAMRAGRPLTDAQRTPWLSRVVAMLQQLEDLGFVVACSALKRSYRERLRQGVDGLTFVHLDVDAQTLMVRLLARTGHFAGIELVPTQLATLELGDDVVAVDGGAPPEAVAAEVLQLLTPTGRSS